MPPTQEIKEKLDIVDVISERIQLQRSGKNFRAVCPFHSEKTPSFFVSPELQRFICFGCHKQGDIFTFIQEIDRLTFPETLELLAQKAGVEIKKEWNNPQEKQRQQMLEILQLSGQYYSYLLNEHPIGESARQYIHERQINAGTRQAFSLGYAPQKWDGLVNYLHHKKKYALEDIAATGLAVRSQQNRYYDRFRDRLMFPLHDHRGRVVGFSGRLLNSEAKEAKYINTPETQLYHKRYLLFGYWQNLEAIREKEAVIITEGEFDVMSSVQAHVRHIVAIKGSALTEDQVRMLARTVKTIYLALDADSAGVEATKRAIALVQNFPVALRVIPLTDSQDQGGKDVDELARHEPKVWRELTKQHVSAFEYVLTAAQQQHDLQTAMGQRHLTDEMLSLINTIEHPIERTFYLRELAHFLQVSDTLMEEQWRQWQQRQTAQRLNSNVKKQSGEMNENQENRENENLTADNLGAYYIQLLLHYPDKVAPSLSQVESRWFLLPGYQRIIAAAQSQGHHDAANDAAPSHHTFNVTSFSQQLPEELQALLAQLFMDELPLDDKMIEREVAVSVTQLAQRWRRQRVARISHELANLEQKSDISQFSQEDKERYQSWQAELNQLLHS